MQMKSTAVSREFVWRRVHSLMGLWLVVYLFEHLLVNSQAALWLGEEHIFVRMVNSLESLPFLHAIEIIFIGVPLLVHGGWGIKRVVQAKMNAGRSSGASPSLPYGRNRAFTWQRLTSWILLFGILGHVVQMRFVQMPKEVVVGNETQYVVKLRADRQLEALASRLSVTLKTEGEQVIASASSPGKAILLMVRETFKNPWMCGLYTVFVFAAAFHAFNGVWTSLITWGVLLSYRSQKRFVPLCLAGAVLLLFFGLAAIWGG